MRLERRGSFCGGLSAPSLFNHHPLCDADPLSSSSLAYTAALSKRNYELSKLVSWHLRSQRSLWLAEQLG